MTKPITQNNKSIRFALSGKVRHPDRSLYLRHSHNRPQQTSSHQYKTNKFTLSQISHEISNPLTLIYSTAQLLTHKHPELHSDELWTQLISDLDYLKQLTVSLSAYNHCDELSARPTDMRQLLADLHTSWLPYACQSHKHFTLEMPDTLPSVVCDPVRLKQCLINLIKNGFEATASQDSISIRADVSGKYVTITIADTGKGLTDDQLAHIFEPFTTYKSNGSGLGLAITEKIIRAHHGKIRVSSEYGHGTRFTLQLPHV